MSEESTREADRDASSAPKKKAAKTAARKTAKKAAKKAVKKMAKKAAKKTAAKKAAKRAPKKVESAQGELALDAPKKEVSGEAKPAEAAPAPRPEPKTEAPRSEGKESASPSVDKTDGDREVKFGRVPGGGPVRRSETQDDNRSGEPAARRDDSQESGRSDSRSEKRRRRRRRRRDRGNQGGNESGDGGRDENEQRPAVLEGPKVEVDGLLELAPKGFGFLRKPDKNFEQARDDVFVSPDLVRKHGLRVGVWIKGLSQQGPRGPQMVEITEINDMPPEEAKRLPAFEELKAVNPSKRISFETTPERYTTRVIDLMSPVGRGQRGLIVSPPRSGKTTLLLHMAEAVQELHDESLHLMVLLVDERPEEVTEFRRALPGVEIYASSNDEHLRNHTRIAEIAIERAKRLVEAGRHVFLLMDSITRLARAYNGGGGGGGGKRKKGRGIGSGGIMVGALETPRRLFAAARNTREAGSLTILATALIQTNSRADDAIFQEFKGTGNMELVLDRKIAENYVYPAVDIFKSGTRREELLLPEHTLHKIHMIRRGLSGHRPLEAMERLLFFLKKFPNNPQMLLEIKG
ncbi:hypothetical protein HAHE_40600 [Haloferula helveola]|uniref:Transcription termination factor Rho n=1 Tax=Haloferula helveola TaxID=490095 RepID=A0ABM7REJ3_9BACT|nr:hypothetical protein HAHE_40600 [Haloferula helveola]